MEMERKIFILIVIKINGVGEILHLLGSRGQTKDYIIHHGFKIVDIDSTSKWTSLQYEESSSIDRGRINIFLNCDHYFSLVVE